MNERIVLYLIAGLAISLYTARWRRAEDKLLWVLINTFVWPITTGYTIMTGELP